MHDQPGLRSLGQGAHPSLEQAMELLLADPDGRIGVQAGDCQVRWHFLRCYHPHSVAHSGSHGVCGAQPPGALIGLDRPDGALRMPQRKGEGDRTVARSEIHKIATRRVGPDARFPVGVRRRGLHQQDPRSWVDALP